MSVWDVYYDHWAKEANKTRKDAFRRRCVEKMMVMLSRQWFYNSDENFLNRHRDLIKQTIMEDMRFYQRADRKMSLISGLAEVLNPKETPRDADFLTWRFDDLEAKEDRIERGPDAPGFVMVPGEIRFWRNMGKNDEEMFNCTLLDAKGAHRLDALLALM